MNIMLNIIGGAIGGIVATILCVSFVGLVWKRMIVPWYEELVYQDTTIEGNWYGVIVGGTNDNNKDTIKLTRNGHNVSGTMHVFGPRAGDYKFEGSFKNLILSVTYAAIDRSQLNRGSITVMLKDNGNRFTGKCVHYDGSKMSIDAQDYEFERCKKT